MFDRPEAAPASLGAMPAVVMLLTGVSTKAWPMARTTLGRKNWSPELSSDRVMFMKQLAAKMPMPTKPI